MSSRPVAVTDFAPAEPASPAILVRPQPLPKKASFRPMEPASHACHSLIYGLSVGTPAAADWQRKSAVRETVSLHVPGRHQLVAARTTYW